MPSIIFAVAFIVFIFSPVRALGETQYTMMLAYTLLHRHTFVLDRDELQLPQQLEMIDGTSKVRRLPLEIANGKIFKYAPPGSSVLSIPFVAIARAFGFTPVDSTGRYTPSRELSLSMVLAALLVSAFAVICFQTARLLLPVSWSLGITAAATLGSQAWSTASRVVEPDSWTMLLLIAALYLTVRSEVRGKPVRPILVASILSWCYFVQPTAAISIVALTAYVWLRHRRSFLPFVLTGACWLVLLVIYSRYNFGQLLPNYFQASRLGFQTFWQAWAGNLVSPSRGLLVYVPQLLFVAYILLRYRESLPLKTLVITGTVVAVVHLFVISGFGHWWAGHSYGPRYWTSVLPWFVLLAIAGVKALTTQPAQFKRAAVTARVEIGAAVLLVLAGVFIHARGALAEETRLWNAKPFDIDLQEGRLWNCRYPQFLAGLIPPPLPAGAYPVVPLNRRINIADSSANNLLWYGWSNPESPIRWTEAKTAAVVFSLEDQRDVTMVFRAAPFVVADLKQRQRVAILLNGKTVDNLTLVDSAPANISVSLPRQLFKPENVLIFDLPDAESPANLGLSDDQRLLGLAVEWMEFTSNSRSAGK